jgi:hypothetical protein
VRVRWDREQLIGGKPERLVSRVLRVLAEVLDQWYYPNEGGMRMNRSCGIDWAEGHHDVAIVDSDGKLVAKKRISDDPAGFSALTELLADSGDSPEDPIPVAIETPRGLLVAALRGTGRPVFAINPMAVAPTGKSGLRQAVRHCVESVECGAPQGAARLKGTAPAPGSTDAGRCP